MSQPPSGRGPGHRRRVPISRGSASPPPLGPEFDPARPVHIAIATPLDAFRGDDDEDAIARDMPAGVADGDTVLILLEARDWAVVRVSVWTEANGAQSLYDVGPDLTDGVSLAAVERRLAFTMARQPATLTAVDGAALVAAIEAEVRSPTPWREIDDACDAVDGTEAIHQARTWGCRGCELSTSNRRFVPRFEAHVGADSPDDWLSEGSKVIGVCPSCHDILHHPLAPTIDELMFSNRPACPECGEHQAFSILRGFPPFPPPPGTRLFGCSVIDMAVTRWVCGACDTEW